LVGTDIMNLLVNIHTRFRFHKLLILIPLVIVDKKKSVNRRQMGEKVVTRKLYKKHNAI